MATPLTPKQSVIVHPFLTYSKYVFNPIKSLSVTPKSHILLPLQPTLSDLRDGYIPIAAIYYHCGIHPFPLQPNFHFQIVVLTPLKPASHCPTDRRIGGSDEKSDEKSDSGRTCVGGK